VGGVKITAVKLSATIPKISRREKSQEGSPHKRRRERSIDIPRFSLVSDQPTLPPTLQPYSPTLLVPDGNWHSKVRLA